MRMSFEQLGREITDDALEVEGSGFLTEPGMKNDLEKQITELFTKLREIVTLNGVDHFIDLLQRVRSDADKVLLQVPGTTELTITQAGHQPQQPRQGICRAGLAHSRPRSGTKRAIASTWLVWGNMSIAPAACSE